VTEPHGNTHDWALAACVLGVIAWSSGPLMIRGITAPVAALTFTRLLISVPVMNASAAIAGHRLTWSLFKASFVPGIFFFTSMAVGFASFQHTSIANATLISSMQPVLMLLVAPRLFGEHPTVLRICLAVVAVGGVSLVVLGAASGGEASLDGDLYAVGNLFAWSTYFVFAKRARDRGVHPSSFLAGVFSIAALLAVPWVLVARPDFGQIGPKDFVLVLGQVFVSGLLGHTVMTWCARYLDITLVSLINLLSPALSMIGAWIIYEQSMRAMQVLGAVIMMVALAFVVATRSKPLVPADEGLMAE
jgi:drug/metabolite transporter (DMT)-like permease